MKKEKSEKGEVWGLGGREVGGGGGMHGGLGGRRPPKGEGGGEGSSFKQGGDAREKGGFQKRFSELFVRSINFRNMFLNCLPNKLIQKLFPLQRYRCFFVYSSSRLSSGVACEHMLRRPWIRVCF